MTLAPELNREVEAPTPGVWRAVIWASPRVTIHKGTPLGNNEWASAVGYATREEAQASADRDRAKAMANPPFDVLIEWIDVRLFPGAAT